MNENYEMNLNEIEEEIAEENYDCDLIPAEESESMYEETDLSLGAALGTVAIGAVAAVGAFTVGKFAYNKLKPRISKKILDHKMKKMSKDEDYVVVHEQSEEETKDSEKTVNEESK